MSEPVPKHLLLFSANGELASEPVHFEEDPDTPPLFKGNKVSKPLCILCEGEFYGHTLSGKTVKVAYNKALLEAIAKNTQHDQAMNFDHFRGGPNDTGWVRASTGKPMYVDRLADGRWGLFAQIEVTPETFALIETGRYRRFSAEVDRQAKRLVGLALTNYPAVDGVHQFTEATHMEDHTELLSRIGQLEQALQEATAQLEAQRKEAEAARERAELNERILRFSEKAQTIAREKLVPGLQELVLQLYLFAAKHDEPELVRFSQPDGGVKEEKLTAVELLDRLFAQLPNVSVFSQQLQETAETKPAEEDEFLTSVSQLLKQRLGR
jgi:DNA-binding transcriptional MerR regulator